MATFAASAPLRPHDPVADLVCRLKAGGPEARHCFEILVARHGPRLRRRAARILGDDSEAEDIVQEVFTNVHRFLDRFTPDRPFSHWLSVVTLNACRIELRRRTARLRRHDAFEADPLRTTANATGMPGDPLLRDALATAFEVLDLRTRDCIVLRVLEGLSYQEIGLRCGQSEAAVKMRVLRGLDTGIANRAVGGELDDAGGPGLERATSSRRLGASRAGDEPRPNAREHQPERIGGARGASERARHGTGSAKIARVEPGATRRAAIAVASAGVGARSSVAAGSRRRR